MIQALLVSVGLAAGLAGAPGTWRVAPSGLAVVGELSTTGVAAAVANRLRTLGVGRVETDEVLHMALEAVSRPLALGCGVEQCAGMDLVRLEWQWALLVGLEDVKGAAVVSLRVYQAPATLLRTEVRETLDAATLAGLEARLPGMLQQALARKVGASSPVRPPSRPEQLLEGLPTTGPLAPVVDGTAGSRAGLAPQRFFHTPRGGVVALATSVTRGALWAGTAEKLHAQVLKEFQHDRHTGQDTFVLEDARGMEGHVAVVRALDTHVTLDCGGQALPLEPVTDAEATVLRRARTVQPIPRRFPVALARDSAGTLYFLDATTPASWQDDYRLWLGHPGRFQVVTPQATLLGLGHVAAFTPAGVLSVDMAGGGVSWSVGAARTPLQWQPPDTLDRAAFAPGGPYAGFLPESVCRQEAARLPVPAWNSTP